MPPTANHQDDADLPGNGLIDRFLAEPELSEAALQAIVTDLVRAPSVNPGMSEAGMVETVERLLDNTGCTTTRVSFAPGRPSLAAVLEGL